MDDDIIRMDTDIHLPAAASGDPFADLVQLALGGLASLHSRRVYGQTYRAWAAFCAAHGLSPLGLHPEPIRAFLTSRDTTRTTRNRQLAALRLLADKAHDYALLHADAGTARRFEGLRNLLRGMKAPAPETAAEDRRERARRALTPAQADKLLRAWDEETPQHTRNRALIAVLLLGGLRRAEAAALLWRDIDFEHGVLQVRHGKGDRRRDVPLAGDCALAALRAWRETQPDGYAYVFTPLRKGGHFTGDRPLTGTDVYRVVKATEKIAGVEFKPHDCRRTYITEALDTGTGLRTVQAAVGHARPDTTLEYAQATDARRARKEFRFRFG
jgi:integrase